jgi:hypothetical protein
MAKEFIHAHPPKGPILQEWGAQMPSFLRAFAPVQGLPYLVDIARIEIARGHAFHAADAEPVSSEKLQDMALAHPELMRLHLHPSVQLLHLEHPGGAIWAAQQPNGPPPPAPDDWAPQIVLVARRGWDDVMVRVLPAPEAAFIEAVLAGHRFAHAVKAAQATGGRFDPVTALSALLQAGLVVDVTVTKKET